MLSACNTKEISEPEVSDTPVEKKSVQTIETSNQQKEMTVHPSAQQSGLLTHFKKTHGRYPTSGQELMDFANSNTNKPIEM